MSHFLTSSCGILGLLKLVRETLSALDSLAAPEPALAAEVDHQYQSHYACRRACHHVVDTRIARALDAVAEAISKIRVDAEVTKRARVARCACLIECCATNAEARRYARIDGR